MILLLAELLENGTSFSPPHTEVEVDAQAFAGGGVTIRIVDHGLGMTTDQLAAENGRLVSRERLDLAPTDVLGLFVVGRLAQDQVADYAKRKGWTLQEAERWLAPNLGCNPED